MNTDEIIVEKSRLLVGSSSFMLGELISSGLSSSSSNIVTPRLDTRVQFIPKP